MVSLHAKMVMKHTLLTGITAETLPGPVRIDLDGCLTEESVKDLIPVLRRGASFEGCPELVVDLRKVDHIEPPALEVLETLTTRHNALGSPPRMSVQLSPRGADAAASSAPRCGADVAPPTSAGSAAGNGSAPEAPSIVADLMMPIGPTIGITQSLKEAADRIAEGQDALTVVGLNDTAIGFISAEDLLAAAQSEPTRWQKKRCASLVQVCESPLRPDDPLEGVIQQYREEGVRPLLVFNGDTPVGLLQPDDVRQWCQDYSPLPLEDLMYKPALQLAEPPEMAAE